MSEAIDYDAVIAQLQTENERLRLHLVKVIHRNDPFSNVHNLYTKYKNDPYVKMVASMLAVYLILTCIQAVVRFILKGLHHER